MRASILLALALTLAPALARADDDKAAAAVAFTEGKRLMGAGSYAKACAMFELSYGDDRQLGTLLNLGDCHEKLGKLATAWAEFGEAIELAHTRRDERENYAKQRRTSLARRLSYVTLRKSRSDSLTVKLNGRDVTTLANIAIPIDPGTHTLTVVVAGETSQRRLVIEHDATRRVIDVPFIPDEDGDGEANDDPDATEPEPDTEPIEHEPPPPVPDDPAPTTPPGTARRTTGMVLGIAGLATLGVGSYFGVRAYMKWSDSRTLCTDDNRCTESGRSLVEQASSAATTANILVGAGLAVVTVGAYLYFTAPSGRTTVAMPVVTPTSAGAVVGFDF